jgi:hypothetical protein
MFKTGKTKFAKSKVVNFPKLMINVNSGEIVLFSEKGKGGF